MSWYDPRDWDKKKAISTGVGLVLGGPVGAYAGYKYGPAVINGIGDAAKGIGKAFGDAADSIDITRAFINEFNSKNPVTATTTTPPE